MEYTTRSRKRSWGLLPGTVLLCLAAHLLQSCGGQASGSETPAPAAGFSRQDNPWNLRLVDSGVHLLRTGDLALRTGADATSHMLRQMNQQNKTFSHCGIVVVENGYPFVYHSIGGEDNPDARIRRDSAHFFFSPVSNIGMGIVRLDLSEAQSKTLIDTALQYFREQRTFDMDFDLETDRKLYCAEFVYKAVQAAARDNSYFSLSHIGAFRYVGVDNLYENKHAKTICRIQYK